MALHKAGEAGWVPYLLVALIFALVSFDWIRETRMAKRINMLEENYTKVLTDLIAICRKAIDDNTAALDRMTTALEVDHRDRACFWSAERQQQITAEAVKLAAREIDG